MGILDFLFPRRCVSCRRLGFYICPRCRLNIRKIETPVCSVCERPSIGGATHPKCKTSFCLDGLTSIWVYDGPIKKAIKELKYRFVTDLARELVSLIDTTLIYRYMRTVDFVLTPVPLHWWRLRWRGFNQAEILGKMIAEKLEIKFVPDLLTRKKPTRPQVELEGKARRENIANAFAINPRFSKIHHPPSNILLFDDVWTTGVTLRACGNVLKRAGVKSVWGLTLAK